MLCSKFQCLAQWYLICRKSISAAAELSHWDRKRIKIQVELVTDQLKLYAQWQSVGYFAHSKIQIPVKGVTIEVFIVTRTSLLYNVFRCQQTKLYVECALAFEHGI